jgi:ribonuclease HIII
MQDVVSLQLTKLQIEDLHNVYKTREVNNTNPYVRHAYKMEACSILVYTSNKVVFQGPEASSVASIFQTPTSFIEHAGSDEVGTGDVFGPVVVCAVSLSNEHYQQLKSLKILDSKILKDEEILEIAPQLEALLPYSLLILDNTTYNKVHQTNNMNAIKAKLHNQAYLHLKNKTQLPKLCVIDQFTPKNSYFSYLKDEPLIFNEVHLETKAESKYPAVAMASIIARSNFLRVMKKLDEHYAFKFPFGAGKQVDLAIMSFIKQHAKEQLYQVAKVHFKNIQNALTGTEL